MLVQKYFEEVSRIEREIMDTQMGIIQEAAERITESLMKGGILHLFGSGHNIIPAKEGFSRTGGLVPVNPLFDANLLGPFGGSRKIMQLQKLEGYTPILLEGYDLQPGEVLVIFTASGRYPVAIDLCLEAQRRGLFVIAVTSLKYSKGVASQHSSGKQLYEVADLVIDNCGEAGDAIVDVPAPGKGRVGPTATIMSVLILHAIFLQVVENYIQQGREPPVVLYPYVADASKRNRQAFDQYRSRLKHL